MPLHIVFEYRDEYCLDGKFHRNESWGMRSVDECIKFFGLDKCEYRIISVEEM